MSPDDDIDPDALLKRLHLPTVRRLVEAQIAQIPDDLASNWVVETSAKEKAQPERVAREPERCLSLVAFAGVISMNRCAVTMGVVSDRPRLSWLAPAPDDHTDARIIGQAAYAHVLVSKDVGLCRRAKRLQELKLFRPEVMRWEELLARPA
jgi:hypothetical protein